MKFPDVAVESEFRAAGGADGGFFDISAEGEPGDAACLKLNFRGRKSGN